MRLIFLFTSNDVPKILIEAKISEDNLDPNLRYFSEGMKGITAIQVVMKPGIFSKKDKNVWVISANRFFNLLWNFPTPHSGLVL